MAEIDNNSNATQLLEAVNTAFGSVTGIQEILASDNAADFIEKLNHNFDVMGTGGDAVFPPNTILPSDIGSLEQGEDIGGMTMEDFITYGIQSMPRKLTFIHTSDNHGNNNGGMTTLDAVQNDMGNVDFAVITGDLQVSLNSTMSNKLVAMNADGNLMVVPGNHDAYNSPANGDASKLQEAIKTWMTYDTDKLSATFGSETAYGCYWYRDFPLGKGKLRVIGIDQYDSGTRAHQNNQVRYTPEQMEWFIDRLEELGGNDYLLLAQHTPPMNGTSSTWVTPNQSTPQEYRRMNDFCSSRICSWDNVNNDKDAQFIPAIIDAYLNGTAINITHKHYDGTTDVSVGCDFANVTPANFCGWLCGHVHADWHGEHPHYPNQLVMCIDCGMYGIDRSSDIRANDDIISGQRSGILYNIVTIDAAKKSIQIERVGNQTTCAHAYNNTYWTMDDADPKFTDNPDYPNHSYVYPQVTRDEITFDFNANEVITNTNNENEN